MANYGTWKHGAAQFPLTASVANDLVQDLDPALYEASRFLAAMIEIHLGERLNAQAKREGLNVPGAVAAIICERVTPQILAENFKFPLLALYRKKETSESHTVYWSKIVSEWEFSYVLPSLSARQILQLSSVLRGAVITIGHAVRQGFDPAYEGGANIWARAGIQSIRLRETKYVDFEIAKQETTTYRAAVGSLEVVERDNGIPGAVDAANAFDGANVGIDLVTPAEATLEQFVVGATHPAPTVTSIAPNSGGPEGGLTVTVAGTGFHVGQPARIVIGELDCDEVLVLSSTQVRGVTPSHAPALSDVVVINFDGQSGRRAAAFTFTQP